MRYIMGLIGALFVLGIFLWTLRPVGYSDPLALFWIIFGPTSSFVVGSYLWSRRGWDDATKRRINNISSIMTDAEFLNWTADKLVETYGEDSTSSFILRIRKVAEAYEMLADLANRVCYGEYKDEQHLSRNLVLPSQNRSPNP